MKNTKMNITVDKEFTTIAQADKVKADIKEFKAVYTPEAVVKAFASALDAENEVSPAAIVALQCGEVLTMTGEAFPGGYVYGDETQFAIESTVLCGHEVVSVRFYTDLGLNVSLYTSTRFDSRLRMFSLERFTRSEAWR